MSRRRPGGLAAWSLLHPVGVITLAITLTAIGLLSANRLNVDLLPRLIYPEIRVRVSDPGVPASVMEERVTRILEEQLALTEGAINIQSTTSTGTSSLDVSFSYGYDIDRALRDASTRLDRARRLLPDTVEQPSIIKRDPSQLPVMELVVNRPDLDPVALRTWAEFELAPWFINLPGVGAVEVGGGLVREVRIEPDPEKLRALGWDLAALHTQLTALQRPPSGGNLRLAADTLGVRSLSRVDNPTDLAQLPLDGQHTLGDVARILDTTPAAQLRVRLNGHTAVRLSIQKQPQANTIAVADAVTTQLDWLRQQQVLPQQTEVATVNDQAIFVRQALAQAQNAALSGALLAMLTVWVFLGDWRRTLIIGTSIPLALLLTLNSLDLAGISLNLMTLGGLALGVGMVVDNSIVMLENLSKAARNQLAHAAHEVTSALIAATTTNLAALAPFFLLGGLAGLLFTELLVTLSVSLAISLLVALTLTPALARYLPETHTHLPRWQQALGQGYGWLLDGLLRRTWLSLLVLMGLLAALLVGIQYFLVGTGEFLPKIDNGQAQLSLTAEPNTPLAQTDSYLRQIEARLCQRPEVQSCYAQVGGTSFGRVQLVQNHRASLSIQLAPPYQTPQWVEKMRAELQQQFKIPGLKLRLNQSGIRGLRISQGDSEINLRIQGADLYQLQQLGAEVSQRLKGVEGLRNVDYSLSERRQEIVLELDRPRLATLGLDAADLAQALQIALEGQTLSDLIIADRAVTLRLQLPAQTPLDTLPLRTPAGTLLPLSEVAQARLAAVPAEITRERQNRIVEISAERSPELNLAQTQQAVTTALATLKLPPGYVLYDAGEAQALREGQQLGGILVGLALLLVFTVMAVQYEALRAPVIILLSVPFALTGVWLGLLATETPISMPVWLGVIMLIGIVVNNAILLVEFAQAARHAGTSKHEAIVQAARLRLRPILMTTLTTILGMLPLALGLGAGAELLQPLAIALVSGMTYALGSSLLVTPITYRLLAR